MIDWKVKEPQVVEAIPPSAGLAPAAELLVCAARTALGSAGPSGAKALLIEACGERAGAVAGNALVGLLHALRVSTRCPISFRPNAAMGGLGVGERLLLDLVAASQARHATWLAALFRWLFPSAQARAARMHLDLLASALATAEVLLTRVPPVPAAPSAFPPAPPAHAMKR